jgi:putative transposase
MEASDLKRVRELEAENAMLKRLQAELALDNAAGAQVPRRRAVQR